MDVDALHAKPDVRKKLELEVEGHVFFKEGLYLEAVLRLTNLEAARHPVQDRGTSCSVWAISRDLRETPILGSGVFEQEEWIEPGESIHDAMVFAIDLPPEEIVWLKLMVRVESGDREWNLTRHIRVEIVEKVPGDV